MPYIILLIHLLCTSPYIAIYNLLFIFFPVVSQAPKSCFFFPPTFQISKLKTCFYSSLSKSSDRVVGIVMVFKLIRKVLWDCKNFLKGSKCESGYKSLFLHSLVPFLTAIRSCSLLFTWNSALSCNEESYIVTSF